MKEPYDLPDMDQMMQEARKLWRLNRIGSLAFAVVFAMLIAPTTILLAIAIMETNIQVAVCSSVALMTSLAGFVVSLFR